MNSPNNNNFSLQTDRPIISVKEARKILAEEAVDLSDSQIEQMVNQIEKMAENALKSSHVRKTAMV